MRFNYITGSQTETRSLLAYPVGPRATMSKAQRAVIHVLNIKRVSCVLQRVGIGARVCAACTSVSPENRGEIGASVCAPYTSLSPFNCWGA